MNDCTAEGIYRWLRNQQINVPRDWLEACLEWLRSENQAQRQLTSQLQKQVFEQWLMTDLCELAHPSLPEQVASEKYNLTGMFCLQVNSVTDISQPMYGQLQQIQNLDNPNSRVSAETQVTQKPWEAKPTRMLMMKLTDGVTEVAGMEYRKIQCIHENIPPGCKIRIKGPIQCRRGVLMLAASNVQFLGGEVEDLASTNSREAVLCQKLNRPPPAIPTAAMQSRNLPGQQNHAIDVDLPQDLISQLTDDDFDTGADSGFFTSTTTLPGNNTAQTSQPSDMDDLSDMDILHEMERMESQQTNTARASPILSHGSKVTYRSTEAMETDAWGDDEDDLLLQQSAIIDFTDRSAKPSSSKQSDVATSRASTKQISIEDAFKQNFKPLSTHLHQYTNESKPQINNKKVNSTTSGVTAQPSSSLCVPPTIKTVSSQNTSSNRNSRAIKSKNNRKIIAEAKPSIKCSDVNVPAMVVKSEQTQEDHCPSLFSRVSSETRRQASVMNSTTDSSTVKINPADAKVTSFDGPPIYLCQAKSKIPIGLVAPLVFTVKAFIVTLLSKLQTDESGWCLNALVGDGTDVMRVQFSNEVLTSLIGFTSKEADDIKSGLNSSRFEELRCGMGRCRDTIIGMCKLMKIEYSKSKHKFPCVQQLLDTDEVYWNNLKARTSK